MKKIHADTLLDTMRMILPEEGSGARLTGLAVQSGKNRILPEIGSEESPEGTLYTVRFPGTRIRGLLPSFLDGLAAEMAKYDSTEVTFEAEDGERRIVEAGERGVRIRKERPAPGTAEDIASGDHDEYGISANRDYFIRIPEASKLLKAIGILDDRNKIRNDKIRKYNQIDRFVEFADAALREILPAGGGTEGKPSEGGGGERSVVTILDCACGKSYLSFVLYYYVTEVLKRKCRVTGLDISDRVIAASRKTAESLGYSGMDFQTADLRTYRRSGPPPDLYISLHACDTATDHAIFTGITAGARAILCVPCCHRELFSSAFRMKDLPEILMKNGVFRDRICSLLTDAIRAQALEASGYSVRVAEYISPLDSPKNILLTALYTGKKNRDAIREVKEFRNASGADLTLPKLLGLGETE